MVRYLRCCGIFSILTMNCISVYAETIPAIMNTNTKIDSAYTLNSNRLYSAEPVDIL